MGTLFLFGLAATAASGFRHWDWPYVLGIGIATFIAYQTATRFQAIHLTREAGFGFLWRHIVIGGALLAIVWALGYGAASLMGR